MTLSATSLATVLASVGQASAFETEKAFEQACLKAKISAPQRAALRSKDFEGLRTSAGLELARRIQAIKAYDDFRNT